MRSLLPSRTCHDKLHTLHELKLASNVIGEEGAIAIAAVMQRVPQPRM